MADARDQASGHAHAGARWRLSRARVWSLDGPRVLAILNMTPDSFSDGGELPSVEAAVERAAGALRDGADGLDIGGESTRPGAARVPPDEQIRRVVPAVRAIRESLDAWHRQAALGFPVPHAPAITVDTTSAAVAEAALDAGADAINDVSAGTEDSTMLGLAARRGAGIILMHRLTTPERDSYSDRYARGAAPVYPGGVVHTVREFLRERARAAEEAGVARDAIVIDPGLGFGKTVEQNLELIRETPAFVELGYPVLSGASRKSFVARACAIGELEKTGGAEEMERKKGGPVAAPLRDRVWGSIALSVLHYVKGARIFRVHDVAGQVQALRGCAAAIKGSGGDI